MLYKPSFRKTLEAISMDISEEITADGQTVIHAFHCGRTQEHQSRQHIFLHHLSIHMKGPVKANITVTYFDSGSP